jgi:hypothetical protein
MAPKRPKSEYTYFLLFFMQFLTLVQELQLHGIAILELESTIVQVGN